jgi:tetratricopeptide (TPR) repeat protein
VQVLKNLGAAGLAALSEGNPAMSASETAGVYERLIRLAGTPEEIEEARFHLADVLLMEDDGARGEEMLKELVRLYPEHAKAYLSYAAYLLGRDRNEEALAMIRQAEGCPDIGEAPSYRSLLLKALKH